MTTSNRVDGDGESMVTDGLEDLERSAVAAFLGGRDADSDDAWTRAFHECVARQDPQRAARCAFWLAFRLLNAGDAARGGGWVARARRLLDRQDCVERGYLTYAEGLPAIFSGRLEPAHAAFAEAAAVGDRYGDPDLVTLARLGEARSLIYLGQIGAGLALLDEVMVAVTAGEVSPIVAGDTYCSAIEACNELLDVQRARAWTAGLGSWSDAQPDLVAYRGICHVHRAEIMLLDGAWDEAHAAAQRAVTRLSAREPAVGAAHYVVAELHRLRGRLVDAEAAYRAAGERGRDPQPGLALLRLAQGRVDTARAAIRRACAEARDPLTRAAVLPACVEIMLAAEETPAAGEAAAQLARLATELDTPVMHAIAAHATGAVLLAESDAAGALAALRRAESTWRAIGAPYEVARVRVRIGLACRALADEESARMELAAARAIFTELSAAPQVVRVDSLAAQAGGHGLTPRELQVLRLVVTGVTNKAIAAQLTLSDRTVDRHVSNIFTKLAVTSRAAATAYAVAHRLV